MPSLAIAPLLKLAARYGLAVAAAAKGLQKLDPEQRQRVMDVLAAADPKRRLRDRVDRLGSTLDKQLGDATDEERRVRLGDWRQRARALQARLALADGLPIRQRIETYASVKRDLAVLVADVTAAETAKAPQPSTVSAGGQRPVEGGAR